MKSSSEHRRIAAQVLAMLAELLGIKPGDVEMIADDPPGSGLVVAAAGKTLVVVFNKSTGAAPIAAALKKVQDLTRRSRRRVVPLLAVPFMGEVGRRLCEEAGVCWIDISGNARLVTPGLRVIVDGKPNRFRHAGRPPSMFAPKSSRIARWLLIHPAEPLSQRQIARATDMSEGFVSRIVSRLEHDGYLARDDVGAVCPANPSLLL